MANSQRQETQVKIGLYIYNGGYRAFEGYPVSLEVWNITANAEMEFMDGQPVTQALDGYEYGNAEGYRLLVSFDLSNIYDSADQTAWRTLFGLLAGQYDRTVWTTTANGAGAGITSLVLQSDAPTTDDYFNNLYVTSLSGGDVKITDYTGASRTCTLASAKTWLSGDGITIKARPNFQTLIGLSVTDDAADIIYYNLDSNLFGILRELTIGRQVITVNLRSVDRSATIPESFLVYG